MSVWSWFLGLFDKNGTLSLDDVSMSVTGQIYFKELAIQSSINLIANAIIKSEFSTFDKGKLKRGENYYLFNVEPNHNQNASQFWREVVTKLVNKNECLIIQIDGKFFIASDFIKTPSIYFENRYSDICINEMKISKSFNESEVFYFELHNEKIKNVIDGLYSSYSKLIEVSNLKYKRKNAYRGTLEVPTNYAQTEKAQDDLKNLLEKRFLKFFSAEGGAVIPLTNGLKYTELNSELNKGTSNDGRDIRSFVDDVFDFVSISLNIPPTLLKGNVADTEKAMTAFLTLCLPQFTEVFEKEINRKLYKKEAFLQRTYMKIDTSRIKVVELKDVANAMDILFRIGAHTINDNLRVLGLEPIEEPWADWRFVTKNYEKIDNAKGGSSSGERKD